MPYNPGSAYPKRTIYIPPTYGDHSYKGAVNANDFSSQNTAGGVPVAPRGGQMFQGMIAEAMQAPVHPGAASGLEASRRHPITGKLSPIGERAIARGAQAVSNVAVPVAKAAITGNITPLVNRAGMAVADRVATRVMGGRMHGPKMPRSPMTHGNPAAIQTRASNTALSDQIMGRVLDGSMPGETGAANVPQLILPTSTKRK